MPQEYLIIVVLFVVGAILTHFYTPLSIRFAKRFDVLDQPGERKIHAQPIPRFGGTAIFATLVTTCVLAIPFIPRLSGAFLKNSPFYISIAVGAVLIFLVGMLDDLRNASIGIRLGVQALAATIVCYFGGVEIMDIGIPLLGNVDLGVLSLPLTVCWIIGVTNALNLIDGLDGLASGVAFIACAAVFFVAFFNGQFFAMASLALLAGSCLGFLRYNFHPAKIFLGDNGSLLLGFLLGCISVSCSLKRSTSFALIIPIQILMLPVLDTLYCMIRRSLREMFTSKKLSPRVLTSMLKADRGHIHHTLLDLGLTQTRTAFVLYTLSALLGALGVASALFLDDTTSLVFLISGVLTFVVIRNLSAIKQSMIKVSATAISNDVDS